MRAKGRVLVAMSGGVDSSVTAYLLKEQGYECVGATMLLSRPACPARVGAPDAPDNRDAADERVCGSGSDVADAEAVAARLGIPHHVIDLRETFERDVVDKFVRTYEAGRTPNPCIDCNRFLKFGALLDHARQLGCDAIATGHYARVTYVPATTSEPETWQLWRGIDPAKDQSYVLYSLTQERLAHVLLPLGELVKDRDVRRIAAEQGFLNADKPDSQGICFVPHNDFAHFIECRRGCALEPGDVLDTAGQVIGRHRGALRYTVGQRKGLGVAAAHPLYVTRIDVERNTVTLGDADDLMASSLVADDWIWSAPAARVDDALRAAGDSGMPVSAKIRYHQPDQPAHAALMDPSAGSTGGIRISFDVPQRGIAPGQAVVIYNGDVVLGGGTVREAW